MLYIDQIITYQNGIEVNQDISLHVKPGDRIVITGSSGIGKTRFLNSLKERCISKLKVSSDHVVYVPQHAEHSFNPLRKIKDHFEDIRQKHKMNKREFYSDISDLFNELNLNVDCLKLYAFECSGGMLQRLQLILALKMYPTLLLLDEPTASLNKELIKKTLELLKKRGSEKSALIVVTHQLDHYRGFATKFINLEGKGQHNFKPIESPNLERLSEEQTFSSMVEGIVIREKRSILRKTQEQVLTVENFYSKKGEIIGIKGESGSGKTTFLHALSGKLQILGRADILSTQYLPQCYDESFPQNRTVLDIIKESQKVAKCSFEECLELLSKLQLSQHLLPQRIRTLSGGQRQRLALLRILLQKPLILLLDEPFANIDNQTTTEISEILVNLTEEGLTIICVSHDEQWIQKYCHRNYTVDLYTIKETTHEIREAVHSHNYINNVSSL